MRKTFTLIAVLALALGWAVPPAGAQLSGPSPLTFHEVTPCALFDTRPSQGGTGIMAANEVRTFHVVGSTSDFAGQGGVAGGCGIPGFAGGAPQVEMVYLNLVAVDPVSAGNLKIWATDDPEPVGGVVNYQKLTPNLNIPNAIVVGVRQDAEGSDVTVKANAGSTHVRGVALGYLTKGAFSFWALGGNAGTNPSTAFVGTTDNQPLNLRVNNERALRLEPNANSPNVIGGFSGNSVTGGAFGATISGGGSSGQPNQVSANFGTVDGGSGNTAGGSWATVGGGLSNTASGSWATVEGGLGNSASGDSATVAGGESNTASGGNATVAGGLSNTAAGQYSLAAGRQAKATHQGAFVWADSTNADFASSVLDEFAVRAGGGVRFVVGGNTCSLDSGTGAWTGSCAPPAQQAWLLGGNAGTDPANHFLGTTDNQPLNVRVNNQRVFRLEPLTAAFWGPSPNLMGGVPQNAVTSGVGGATIGGGGTSTTANVVSDHFGTIGGGLGNQAGNSNGNFVDAMEATVSGGSGNIASGNRSTVAGGSCNRATGPHSTVGGGGVCRFMDPVGNLASGQYATVGGGQDQTASGDFAVVAGGFQNVASGVSATVPGGGLNVASGQHSFAAGREAVADDAGAFVWADDNVGAVNSPGANTFTVEAVGGIWLGTGGPPATLPVGRFIDTSTGAHLTTSGVWANASSRTVKAGFRPVDRGEILDRVASLPITTWHYAAEPGVPHIGPVAEDFHAAFGVGADDATIGTVDADGVALAAIQGLNEKLEVRVGEQDAAIASLREEMASGHRGAGGPGVPQEAMWGLAVAFGLVGLGLGRRWGRTEGGMAA